MQQQANNGQGIDLKPENHRTIMQLVQGRQTELIRSHGLDRGESYIVASNEVAQTINPPCTGKELRSWIGSVSRQKQLAQKKNEGEAKRSASFSERYEQWALDHNLIPSDQAVAFFSGVTPTACNFARKRLEKGGWAFEKRTTNTENGSSTWAVVARPQIAIDKIVAQSAIKINPAANGSRLKEIEDLAKRLLSLVGN